MQNKISVEVSEPNYVFKPSTFQDFDAIVDGSQPVKKVFEPMANHSFKEELEKEAEIRFPLSEVPIFNPSIRWNRQRFKHGANWAYQYLMANDLNEGVKKTTIPAQAETEKLKKEIEELKGWKESAISVMPDYQEIGKLLNIPLGQSVHDKIIPALKKLIGAHAVGGMRWRSGNDLPEDDGYDEPTRYVCRFFGDDPRSGVVSVALLTLDEMKKENWDEGWEWLDESKEAHPNISQNVTKCDILGTPNSQNSKEDWKEK